MEVPFVTSPAKRTHEWEHREGNGRKKRRSSASARGTPPPIRISPDETVFRILCTASKTGRVVGKGGNIIKQIRQETGARIRIEEGVMGCDERVIIIVALGKDKKGGKEQYIGSDGDEQSKDVADEISGGKVQDESEQEEKKGSESEKDFVSAKSSSPAQEALFRVHDRILEGESDKKADDEADRKTSPIVTRLLVPTNQVGCVLGKGGKTIQQICAESGAQIRVLSRYQLPACALSTDEVIQIIGDASSVKKALHAVSDRLCENPNRDGGQAPAPRIGGLSHGSTPLSGDSFPPSKSSSSFSGVGSGSGLDYSSRGPAPILYETGVNMGQRKPSYDDLSFRLLCTNDKVGGIIGKGGRIIKGLENETGADIKIAEVVPDEDERVIVITGPVHPEARLSPAQNAVLRVQKRIVDSTPDKDKNVAARLLVPSNQIGCLLGKGGTIIAEMRKASGANIRIFGKEQLPKCASQNDEVVQVSGVAEAVQEALVLITSRLRNNLFEDKSGSVTGVGMYPPSLSDCVPQVVGPVAPYRGIHEPSSFLGIYSHLGAPLHDTIDQPGGIAYKIDRPAFPQNIYGHVAMPHNIDQPPSPGSWVLQGIGTGSARSMNDYGGGYPQRGAGGYASASQLAVVTNTTVEVVVPDRIIDSIYGENGNNLAQIRQISGAKLTLHEPRPGSTEGLVVVSGTPEQTLAAQSLLQAFIMSEQSSP